MMNLLNKITHRMAKYTIKIATPYELCDALLWVEWDVACSIRTDFYERVKKNITVITDKKAKVINHPSTIRSTRLCEG